MLYACMWIYVTLSERCYCSAYMHTPRAAVARKMYNATYVSRYTVTVLPAENVTRECFTFTYDIYIYSCRVYYTITLDLTRGY